MSAVCVIPAKGHSGRIPGKNVRHFHGKPIIAYSILAAQQSCLFDDIVVSTDDRKVADVANHFGARYVMRPPELSAESVGTQEVAAWTLGRLPDYDKVCCVYPCAPMISSEDLRFGLDIFESVKATFRCVYVPAWYYWTPADGVVVPVDAVTGLCLTPDWTRWTDINVAADWSRAESTYARLHNIPMPIRSGREVDLSEGSR